MSSLEEIMQRQNRLEVVQDLSPVFTLEHNFLKHVAISIKICTELLGKVVLAAKGVNY